jgi:hypothetical protein
MRKEGGLEPPFSAEPAAIFPIKLSLRKANGRDKTRTYNSALTRRHFSN